MTLADPSIIRELTATLEWWRAAGVDCDFTDDATAWLVEPTSEAVVTGAVATQPEKRAAPQDRVDAPLTLAPNPVPPALLGESPPADLGTFTEWWLSAPALGATRAYPRIAPRGEAGAALMVLVPQPEEGDRDHLLSGAQGRLLANIFLAMGIEDRAVYLAAALPCHTPMADLAGIAASGMAAVTMHHIALARPARLLVLGTGLAPMIGTETAQPIHNINHAGGTIPVMMSETLEAMMDMPQLKARFWRRWMEWSVTV